MRTPATLIFLASLVLLAANVAGTSLEVTEHISRKEGPWDTCREVREEAYTIRNEGYTAVDKADNIREQAYRTKDEAFELKEEALEIKESVFEGRLALENTLVETLALMKSQTTVTNLYIQEMRTTLSSIVARVDNLEKTVETKMEELQEKVTETVALTGKIGKRQQVWMSEIRLISHFKVTEQNNRNAQGYDSDIVVDGQFLFATTTHTNMRPYSHTLNGSAGNKVVIRLGGLFRIHKIKLWNTRDLCCMDRLVGVHVYTDTRLVGTVIETKYTYDYILPEEDPVYAESVIVLQPLARYLHMLEVQVWGNGPFDRDDICT